MSRAPITCPVCGAVHPPPGAYRHIAAHGNGLKASTPELRARVVELYGKRGASIKSVAAQVPLSRSAVRNVLLDEGVQLQPRARYGRRLSVDDELLTTQLYGQGLSIARVADVLGMSPSAVHARLVRSGVTIRPRGSGERVNRIRAEDGELAVELYRQGLSMGEVARRLGLSSHRGVRLRLRAAGVVPRSRSEAQRLWWRSRRSTAQGAQ